MTSVNFLWLDLPATVGCDLNYLQTKENVTFSEV